MIKRLLEHSSFFIVINIVVVLFGIYSYLQLKIQLLPNIPVSNIYISIINPNVKPDLIEKYTTKPFEEVFSHIDGLKSIIAISQLGESKITLSIAKKVPIEQAINQVRDLILKNKALLPEGAKEPIISTESFSVLPMMYIAVSSKNNVSATADDIELIKKKLKYVDGVANTSSFGVTEKVINIDIDPEKIAKYYIPLDSILASLTLQNSDFSGGKLSNQYKTEYISFDTAINKLSDFGEINLESNNVAVKLKNIASITISDKELLSLAYFGMDKIVLLGIFAKSDANPIDVSKSVKHFLEHYEKANPQFIFQVIIDDSQDILQAFQEVRKTLLESVLLVSVIVLLIMGSLRYSIIAICAIPVSLAACFVMLYLCGFTLNAITMLAMVLAIGLVVDDSIVVIENAEHYYRKNKDALTSILQAIYSLFLSVLILMFTLVVIYVPILFIKGEVGKILQEFALSVIACLVMSFIVAFTLTPILFLKLANNTHESKFVQIVNKTLDMITYKYQESLFFIIRHAKVFLSLVAIVVAAGTYVAVNNMKIEIEPFEKKDMLILTNTFMVNTNLSYIHHYMEKITKIIKDNDNVKYTLSIEESPRSTIWLILKDKAKAVQTLHEIEAKLAKIAVGGDISVKFAQGKNAGSAKGNVELSFYVNNQSSMENAWQAVHFIQNNSKDLFTNVIAIEASPVQDYKIWCNQDKLFKYGLSQKDISSTLDILFNARKIGNFKHYDNTYDVIAKSDPKFGKTLSNIQNMFITTQKNGENLIQLKDICDINRVNTVNQIMRYNEQYSIEVIATAKHGIKLQDAVHFINQLNSKLPNDSDISYSEQTQILIDSTSSFTVLILLSVLGLYLLMFARFNDSILSLFILVGGIPAALSVALLSLYFSQGGLNIYTQISLITLAGLMTKHSVLLCSAMHQKGQRTLKTIVTAATSRIRAILITSLAMSIGLLSLFFDNGNYANSRFQMAIVLVIGIVIGSILTLYVTPLLYVGFHQMSRVKRARGQ
ncbi:efflux RND transporter permease subunit [Candidatus Tisiphia endosymbiont of Piscicola geometra]|uniref:efflux RND transporter permease subunit n=1 Tax=Candidatus Tisiphia endosymbiont of Piscicola geometra TaxID=3066273 RepID=UPI00312CB577